MKLTKQQETRLQRARVNIERVKMDLLQMEHSVEDPATRIAIISLFAADELLLNCVLSDGMSLTDNKKVQLSAAERMRTLLVSVPMVEGKPEVDTIKTSRDRTNFPYWLLSGRPQYSH